jgi:hypothetical protein
VLEWPVTGALGEGAAAVARWEDARAGGEPSGSSMGTSNSYDIVMNPLSLYNCHEDVACTLLLFSMRSKFGWYVSFAYTYVAFSSGG